MRPAVCRSEPEKEHGEQADDGAQTWHFSLASERF